jgi:hypothetical protein
VAAQVVASGAVLSSTELVRFCGHLLHAVFLHRLIVDPEKERDILPKRQLTLIARCHISECGTTYSILFKTTFLFDVATRV